MPGHAQAASLPIPLVAASQDRAFRFSRQILAITVLVGLSMVFFITTLVVNFQVIGEISRMVPRLESLSAQEEAVSDISTNVFEMQTARRGYILTGDEQFARALNASAGKIRLGLTELEGDIRRQHGAGAAPALQTVPLLELVSQYEAQLRASVALRRNQPQAMAEQHVMTLAGEAMSRVIHKSLNALERDLEKQFDSDTRSLLGKAKLLQQGEGALAVVGLVLLLVAYLIAVRGTRSRNLAKRALKIANADLENQVQQRTAALMTNEAVTKEQLGFIDQLLEAIPLPLSVRDERGHYLRINRAYEIMFGCDRALIRQRSVFDVLPYDLASAAARHDVAAMRSSRSVAYESDVQLPAGSGATLLTRACAVRRDDGSAIGVIAIDTDVTELRHKETELLRINGELETLSQRLIRSQETERRRIARDLHDQVGQILTALKMSLELTDATKGAGEPTLHRSIELADDALRHTRSLTASLHPHILEDLGLEAAVRWQVDRFVSPAVVSVAFEILLEPPRGTADHELVAFRVVQESLTNVMRHSKAASAKVTLQTRAGLLHIEVADDGIGFEVAASVFGVLTPTSLGLASMRERVIEIGGDFAIESADGEGTIVRAVLPWQEAP